jgi:hypothetical protein
MQASHACSAKASSACDSEAIRHRNNMDGGKDSGQKLTDVSYRSAEGPWNSSQAVAMIRARSTHRHPTDIMGTGVFTKPLAPSLM